MWGLPGDKDLWLSSTCSGAEQLPTEVPRLPQHYGSTPAAVAAARDSGDMPG